MLRPAWRRRAGASLSLTLAVLHAAPGALADGGATPPVVDSTTERARVAYTRGVGLVREQQWGDALAAFEEAAALRDAPAVQFNIAVCLRALGRYVAAGQAIDRALVKPDALDAAKLAEATAYKAEFAQLVVHVSVSLDPAAAKLAVDGRPLIGDARDPTRFLAGVAPPGEPTSPGPSAFTLVLDPGAHLLRAVRAGHQDAVVARSYRPGERSELALHLDVLPATIALRSDPPLGIVHIDRREVGLAPVEFERVGGTYQLEVTRDDYVPYRATLDLAPGQRADITAKLVPYHAPIYKKWWFWTIAGAVISGAAAGTYFAVRPAPTRPPSDAGGLGYIVTVP